MDRRDRIRLFDHWAGSYDRAVRRDGAFPFDGYDQVLDRVLTVARAQPGMNILDLGIGTANLAMRFADSGCGIWGIDFSAEMLAKAAVRLPQAVLIEASLLDDWPAELSHRFDRIVSAYVLHEFSISTKIELLQRLAQHHLASDGLIVIGDVAFPTAEARERARRQWTDAWDDEEHYWAGDEALRACATVGLQATYEQISSCGGIFAIRQAPSGR